MTESVNFDRAASFYDQTRGFPPGEEIPAMELIAKTGGLTPHSRVLEVGVGTGRIALPLSRLVGSYYGVDISTGMMGRLQEKDKGSIGIAQADIAFLPFPDAAFDAVVGVHIFHLVGAWQQAINEARRVLKPGGVLLLCGNGKMENSTLDEMWAVWNEATKDENRTVGIRDSQLRDYLLENGWQRVADQATYMYSVTFQPARMVQEMAERSSSSTWHLSDAAMEQGLTAVRAAMQQFFPQPEAEVPTRRAFHVDAFRPV